MPYHEKRQHPLDPNILLPPTPPHPPSLPFLQGLLATAAGGVHPSALATPPNWSAVPATLPVVALAFVFHNVVPVITTSLEGDVRKIRAAIMTGVLIPYTMFVSWEAAILGSADINSSRNSSSGEVVSMLERSSSSSSGGMPDSGVVYVNRSSSSSSGPFAERAAAPEDQSWLIAPDLVYDDGSRAAPGTGASTSSSRMMGNAFDQENGGAATLRLLLESADTSTASSSSGNGGSDNNNNSSNGGSSTGMVYGAHTSSCSPSSSSRGTAAAAASGVLDHCLRWTSTSPSELPAHASTSTIATAAPPAGGTLEVYTSSRSSSSSSIGGGLVATVGAVLDTPVQASTSQAELAAAAPATATAATAEPAAAASSDPLEVLSKTNPIVGPLVQGFSFLAIATSYIGFILGLTDFMADALKLPTGRQAPLPYLLTLLPPFVFAVTNPNMFLKSLDVAGERGLEGKETGGVDRGEGGREGGRRGREGGKRESMGGREEGGESMGGREEGGESMGGREEGGESMGGREEGCHQFSMPQPFIRDCCSKSFCAP